jgi:plastocyanin
VKACIASKNLMSLKLFFILLMAVQAMPVTHNVQFGGAVGNSYSPNQFSAAVGDTVQWSGNFALHPLSSTTLPSGAASWHSGSGNTFRYAIRIAGDYGYKCDVHVGMTGSFNSMNLGLKETSVRAHSPALHMTDIAPNPSFDNDVIIRYILDELQRITLKLYSMRGDKVLTVDRGIKEAGAYQVIIPSERLPSGVYICRLEGRTAETRRLISVR